MLELTCMSRQANPYRRCYDFSLVLEPAFAYGFADVGRDRSEPVAKNNLLHWPNQHLIGAAIPPETPICEQYPLETCDRVAHRSSVLPFRRQIRRPLAACGGHRDRIHGGWTQRALQRVEQPLLHSAAGKELGQLRSRNRHLLRACDRLYRARRLSALPQSVATDPLAKLADPALSRRMAG